MDNKINHSVKAEDSDGLISWEPIIRDLSLGIICTVMAYFGWQTGIMLMAIPTGFVGAICYCSVLLSIAVQLNENKKYRKKQQVEADETKLN
jgi:hypothetical protein